MNKWFDSFWIGGEYLNVDNMTGQLNYSVQPVAEAGARTDSLEVREPASLTNQRRAAKDGYSTVLTTSLSNRHFRRSHSTARHLFFCVYSIPSTDIKQTRVLEFYPGSGTQNTHSDKSGIFYLILITNKRSTCRGICDKANTTYTQTYLRQH